MARMGWSKYVNWNFGHHEWVLNFEFVFEMNYDSLAHVQPLIKKNREGAPKKIYSLTLKTPRFPLPCHSFAGYVSCKKFSAMDKQMHRKIHAHGFFLLRRFQTTCVWHPAQLPIPPESWTRVTVLIFDVSDSRGLFT